MQQSTALEAARVGFVDWLSEALHALQAPELTELVAVLCDDVLDVGETRACNRWVVPPCFLTVHS